MLLVNILMMNILELGYFSFNFKSHFPNMTSHLTNMTSHLMKMTHHLPNMTHHLAKMTSHIGIKEGGIKQKILT